MELDDALWRLRALQSTLREYIKGDREQEVTGIAVPVLDAVLGSAREHVPEGDPVLRVMYDVISPETVEQGEPIRAIDALLVVDQLVTALQDYEEHGEPISLRPEPSPFDE